MILSSCTKIGDISLIQYKVLKALPDSFHHINITISAELCNNGPRLAMDSVNGELFRNGVSLGSFALEPFEIPGKATEWSTSSGVVMINENVSLLDIIGLAQSFNMEEYSIDLKADVRLGVLKKTIHKNNIPLKDLVNRTK